MWEKNWFTLYGCGKTSHTFVKCQTGKDGAGTEDENVELAAPTTRDWQDGSWPLTG